MISVFNTQKIRNKRVKISRIDIVGLGGVTMILSDVLKLQWAAFLFQDNSLIKQNLKKKLKLMHFWPFAPRKTELHLVRRPRGQKIK